MLGFVLVPGIWITFMVQHGLQTAGVDSQTGENGQKMIMVIPVSVVVFVFAFIVGAIVISMTREVAHSGLAIESGNTDS
jgi:hypothetical protein